MLYYSLSNSGTWRLTLILICLLFIFYNTDKCRGSVCCKLMTHALEIAGIALEITWGSGFVAVLPFTWSFRRLHFDGIPLELPQNMAFP